MKEPVSGESSQKAKKLSLCVKTFSLKAITKREAEIEIYIYVFTGKKKVKEK